MERGAVVSPCGDYRYLLTRTWSTEAPVTFVMLNPSTADATEDDPTTRKCITLAKAHGAGGIRLVNLFAWRSTDPTQLPADKAKAVGADNNSFLQLEAKQQRIIFAWGALGALHGRGKEVYHMFQDYMDKVRVLGVTKTEQPKHPLYLRNDTPLIEWKPSWSRTPTTPRG